MVLIKLFGPLKERAGFEKLEIEASSWREALLKAREISAPLREVIDESGEPVPGYVVFVDGVDYRLLKPDEPAKEIAVIPVVHGGRVFGVNVSNYRVNLGWLEVYVSTAFLESPLPANSLPSSVDNVVIVGLPALEQASPCKLALSYVYALEDRELGSRVKKTSILVLMNLLGVKQIKDVVDRVKEVSVIAALGLRPDVPQVLTETLRSLGLSSVPQAGFPDEVKCDILELEEVTISRVSKI